jgi:hypothetical protein
MYACTPTFQCTARHCDAFLLKSALLYLLMFEYTDVLYATVKFSLTSWLKKQFEHKLSLPI